MNSRKKKLRLIQFSLFLLGLIIIFLTYKEDNSDNKKLINAEVQKKIDDKLLNDKNIGDVFFNIQYSGLDMSGNRYILKSAEAYNDKLNQEIVNMKSVNAFFYFKDENILYVDSNSGKYNNKTLDMIFEDGVEAKYNESVLYAGKAEYSNTAGFLTISEEVKIKNESGTIFADKLLFDIKNQTLNIVSETDNTINAEINVK